MGLFDKIFSNGKTTINERIQSYREIVDILGLNIDDCRYIDDPRAYYNENRDVFIERGIEDNTDDETIIWFGIVNEMISTGKVIEFDWKEELDEFIYGIERIAPKSLLINNAVLDESEDITKWAQIITESWSDHVIASIDIDSDSYVTFVCKKDELKLLSDAANKTNHRIALTQNM